MNFLQYYRACSLVFACLSVAACGDALFSSDGGFDSTPVKGGRIGNNYEAIAELRKPISVSLATSDPKFSIGEAYAARSEVSDLASAYLMLYAQNITADETLCSFKLEGASLMDGSGTVLYAVTNNQTYINSSVRKVIATGEVTNTCLQPNEKGIFLISNSFTRYNKVKSISISSISYTISPTQSPAANLEIYDTYTISRSDESGQHLKVPVKNNGNATASLFHPYYSKFVLLDSSGKALYWDYLYIPPNAGGYFYSGAIVEMENPLFSYDGISYSINVYFDYYE